MIFCHSFLCSLLCIFDSLVKLYCEEVLFVFICPFLSIVDLGYFHLKFYGIPPLYLWHVSQYFLLSSKFSWSYPRILGCCSHAHFFSLCWYLHVFSIFLTFSSIPNIPHPYSPLCFSFVRFLFFPVNLNLLTNIQFSYWHCWSSPSFWMLLTFLSRGEVEVTCLVCHLWGHWSFY